MNDDWVDCLFALLDADARFLVIGAHAMAVHGVPRGTQDLDVWIEPEAANAAHLWTALASFGAPLASLGVSPADLERRGSVIHLGLPPHRIDLLTVNKRAAGRRKDLSDLEALGELPPSP